MPHESARPWLGLINLKLFIVISITTYCVLSFSVLMNPEFNHFGSSIYDYYYLRILDGRLDLPARILRFEGHYLADGTAYTYHGVAPLLSRFLLGWFWPFSKIAMGPFSIFLWAIASTILLHYTIHRLIKKFQPDEVYDTKWQCIIAIMVWFASPGLFYVANSFFYHETSVIAYFSSIAFIYAFSRYHFFGGSFAWSLIVMSASAALSLHARPNVAVGLYCAVLLFITWELYINRFRGWRVVVCNHIRQSHHSLTR